jgi:hypothetical protein
VKATQPDDCGARDDDLDILARYGKIKTGSNFAGYCSERLMKFKVTVLFTIVSLLLFVGPSAAADFTYQEYTKASELWKRGFAFGISRYMSAVAQPDEEAPLPGAGGFPAMPHRLNGCTSCPTGRGVCRGQSCWLQRANGCGHHQGVF